MSSAAHIIAFDSLVSIHSSLKIEGNQRKAKKQKAKAGKKERKKKGIPALYNQNNAPNATYPGHDHPNAPWTLNCDACVTSQGR